MTTFSAIKQKHDFISKNCSWLLFGPLLEKKLGYVLFQHLCDTGWGPDEMTSALQTIPAMTIISADDEMT